MDEQAKKCNVKTKNTQWSTSDQVLHWNSMTENVIFSLPWVLFNLMELYLPCATTVVDFLYQFSLINFLWILLTHGKISEDPTNFPDHFSPHRTFHDTSVKPSMYQYSLRMTDRFFVQLNCNECMEYPNMIQKHQIMTRHGNLHPFHASCRPYSLTLLKSRHAMMHCGEYRRSLVLRWCIMMITIALTLRHMLPLKD